MHKEILTREQVGLLPLIKAFGLKRIMEFTKEKYSMFNIYVGLQGLVYFKDADEDSEKQRFKMLQKADWRGIKKYIVKEVNSLKRSL